MHWSDEESRSAIFLIANYFKNEFISSRKIHTNFVSTIINIPSIYLVYFMFYQKIGKILFYQYVIIYASGVTPPSPYWNLREPTAAAASECFAMRPAMEAVVSGRANNERYVQVCEFMYVLGE
jgi:hypothetical protein